MKQEQKKQAQAILEYIILFIAVISVLFGSVTYITKTRNNVVEDHFQQARQKILSR